MSNQFQTLGLDNWIVRLCSKIGFEKPTIIQKQVIPPILQGKCIIANAETGSGKTASFAFPILNVLAKDPYGIFCLVITPNRELAFQIAEQFLLFGTNINLRTSVIVGGQDMVKQLKDLDKIPHVVVATPGRLLEMIDKSLILQEYLQNLKFLVLDEADRLFSESLLPDVKQIYNYLPQKKQIILATATLTDNLQDDQINQCLGEKLQFEKYIANEQRKVVESLQQKYLFIPEIVKDFYFVYLVNKFSHVTSMIIFVNKCRQCYFLTELLKSLGQSAVSINSYLKQGRRIANLKKFRNSQAKILVATDVASRGLDLQTVDIVINYDLPLNPDDYIHRVGRTARKGKRGIAISIITQHDIKRLQNIEEHINEKLENFELKEEDVLEDRTKIVKASKVVKLKMVESGIDEEFEKEEEYRKSYQKFLKLRKKKNKKQKKQNKLKNKTPNQLNDMNEENIDEQIQENK